MPIGELFLIEIAKAPLPPIVNIDSILIWSEVAEAAQLSEDRGISSGRDWLSDVTCEVKP